MSDYYNYPKSDCIEVFPSGFRGAEYIKAKLTSEENLTSFAGKLSADKYNNRFVMRDPADSNYFILGLDGYEFRVTCEEYWRLISQGGYVAHIRLRENDTTTGDTLAYGSVLDNLSNPGSTLDELGADGEYHFMGLEFLSGKPDDPDNEIWMDVSADNSMRLSSNEVRNYPTGNALTEQFNTKSLGLMDSNTGVCYAYAEVSEEDDDKLIIRVQ